MRVNNTVFTHSDLVRRFGSSALRAPPFWDARTVCSKEVNHLLMQEYFEHAFQSIEDHYLVFFPDYLFNGFKEFKTEYCELYLLWHKPTLRAISWFVRRCREFFSACIFLGFIPSDALPPYTFDSSLPTVLLTPDEECIAPVNATQYINDEYQYE